MLTKICVILFSLLVLAMPAHAQARAGAQATIFGAPGFALGGGESVATFHLGGGGEFVWSNGLGIGADIGYLSAAEEFEAGVGIFSPGLIYEFRTAGRTRPYVRGGYTLLFREGTANLLHFGGGLNHWFSERFGVKFEVRDHLFVEAPELNLLEFNVGLIIRPRQ